MELILNVKEAGKNGLFEIWTQLDNFVSDNFDLLYEGACRLGFNIKADYYAPKRIQVLNTRLHESQHLKYADGYKYDDDNDPSEEQLKNTVRDLQILLDAAAKDIPIPFTLIIQENKNGNNITTVS